MVSGFRYGVSHSFMVWVSEQCLPPVGAKSQEERSSAEKRPSAHSVSACGALPHGPYFVHDRDISELRGIATRLYVKVEQLLDDRAEFDNRIARSFPVLSAVRGSPLGFDTSSGTTGLAPARIYETLTECGRNVVMGSLWHSSFRCHGSLTP